MVIECLNQVNFTYFIEKLCNMPGVEEVKTEIVLDRVKRNLSIIIPE